MDLPPYMKSKRIPLKISILFEGEFVVYKISIAMFFEKFTIMLSTLL